MAEDKKGFILYADQKELFDQLPNDKAGELIKHIFNYVNDENPITDDLLIKLAFTPIKQQFKRDLQKWETTREGRSKAGKASAEARKNKKEQASTNSTNVKSVQQTSTNPTVNDNVNVNVTVNDNVKVNDIKEIKVYSNEIHDCFNNCLIHFDKHLHPKKIDTWLDAIEKLNRIDEIPLNHIERIVELIRKDEFWAKNFLALPKLRKTNKEGIKYIIVFNEHLKSKTNGTTKTRKQRFIEEIERQRNS